MDGYFFEEKSLVFQECFKGCLKCNSSKKCMECDSGKGFLHIKFNSCLFFPWGFPKEFIGKSPKGKSGKNFEMNPFILISLS